jgi:hypothetical protein
VNGDFGTVLNALASVAVAGLSFASATYATRKKPARPEPAAEPGPAPWPESGPESGPPMTGLPPAEDPARTVLRATGTVDLTVTIHDQEGNPRMPGRHETGAGPPDETAGEEES